MLVGGVVGAEDLKEAEVVADFTGNCMLDEDVEPLRNEVREQS
jgi:hypothetical protein